STYDFTHRKVHPSFRMQVEQRGYGDLYLFDPMGNMVYSVRKDADFATSFVDGIYADTGLARAVQRAIANPEAGSVVFEDFSAYAPRNGLAAGFMATPVLDPHNRRLVGVLAVRVSQGALNAMMRNNDSLGATGESFIVGTDYLMRNDSPFTDVRDTLTTRYENELVEQALAGTRASGIRSDY